MNYEIKFVLIRETLINISFLLKFYGLFLIVVLAILFIYALFTNKNNVKSIHAFLQQSEKLKPVVFKNVKVSFSETNKYKHYISFFDKCELYLFDKYIAILRKRSLIYSLLYPPILVTNDIAKCEKHFKNFKIIVPNKFAFNKFRKDEFEIECMDTYHKYFKTKFLFNKLSDEHILAFKAMEKDFYSQCKTPTS